MFGIVKRLKAYFLKELWLHEPQPGWRGWPHYLARTGVLVVEGSWNQELLVRAAALTFKVAFSIVPLFAVLLALFKGFGGFKNYTDKVREFLISHLAGGLGDKVTTNLNEIIDRTDATAIGVVGFCILLYSSISLLSSIEQAFNVIWGVRRQRSIMRQVTIYWTLLTIGPIALALSLAAVAFLQSQTAYTWLVDHIPLLGGMILRIVPFLGVWFAFGMMFMVMPNTKVPWRAAAIGAIVSGTAWQILFMLYVAFNKQILSQYAVYGSLSVIPVFLLWIYISWVIILFGAEFAFAAHHVRTYRREIDAPKWSQAFKEKLAVHIMVELARDFTAGRDPATAEQMAQRLRMPVRSCSEVLFNLTGAKLLREMVAEKSTTYVPGMDLGQITLRRIVEGMRRHGDEPALEPAGFGDRLDTLLQGAENLASKHLEGTTLKELAGAPTLHPPAAQN